MPVSMDRIGSITGQVFMAASVAGLAVPSIAPA
jgi:hypothetical protein